MANEMFGYRDLPMASHGIAAMTHPRVREAFEQFGIHKPALLQRTSERDAQLLDMMRARGQ